MARPMLALVLVAVMAGAWYRVLHPAVPTAAQPWAGQPEPVATAQRVVPVVRLDHLAAQRAARPAPGDERNPFRASAPAPHAPGAASATSSTPSAVPGVATGPPPPAWPRLELIGLAESSRGGGLERTAIVSGSQGVLHARPGDVLMGVYRLERIGVDGVEVRLLPEDRILRFPLRR